MKIKEKVQRHDFCFWDVVVLWMNKNILQTTISAMDDDDDNIFDATTPIFICMSLVASAQRVIIVKK